jgi:hypothetical protein
MYFLEEAEIYTHCNKDSATDISNDFLIFKKLLNKFGKAIAEDHQEKIAHPDTGYKTKSSFMAIVKALFDDGEYHGAYGYHE